MKKILIATFCMFLFAHSGVAAAAQQSATPDPSINPALRNIQQSGAKLYYLGNRSGIDGWFIIKGGQVQIAYAAPDNKGLILGAMFGQDGENISALQVSTLAQNNKEVADLILSAQNEQNAISQAGTAPVASGAVASGQGAMPAVPMSPGERLIHDLSAASTVVIGTPASPEILMVMDPRCPHCQATWKVLRDNVMKGALHIRMVPIGAPNSDNERAASVLLTVADPLTAWDKYVMGGDKTTLAGVASPAALAGVRANHTVIDAWKIESTPYLVYRGKDGKVKVVLGEPDKVSVVLGDLGL